MPQVAETRRIERVDFAAPSDAIEAVNEHLREAVRACSAAEVFDYAVRQVRFATTREIPWTVFHLLLRSSLRRTISTTPQEEILRRFRDAGDRTAFGLMNAVTSVARDQDDPEVRWQLEELGGGVPAMTFLHVRPDGSEAELMVSEVQERFAVAASRF